MKNQAEQYEQEIARLKRQVFKLKKDLVYYQEKCSENVKMLLEQQRELLELYRAVGPVVNKKKTKAKEFKLIPGGKPATPEKQPFSDAK